MTERTDLGYAPPRLTTWRGMREALEIAQERVAKRLAPVFLDAVFLATLWMLVSYLVSWLLWKDIRYLLVPWWVYALGIIEVTALWQSFGQSLGLRISRRHLVGKDGQEPGIYQRLIYYLLWHVSVLPIISLAFRHPMHERFSGLETASFVRGGERPAPWYQTASGVGMFALAVVAMISAFALTIRGDTWANFTSNYGSAAKIIGALFDPDHTLWPNGVSKLFETIYMALMATVFGVIVAVPLSFFAARNLAKNPIARLFYTIIRGVLSILRSVQPILWAIIFLIWVGVDRAPFAGFLALFIHSVADLTKLYAERLESIDNGPIEAITATGGSWISVLRFAVIPQIVNPYISFTLYRWDINIRMATVLGLVGAGGIGQPLIRYLSGQRYHEAAIYIYLITALVWGIDVMSSRLRKYFEEGRPITAQDLTEAQADVVGKARLIK